MVEGEKEKDDYSKNLDLLLMHIHMQTCSLTWRWAAISRSSTSMITGTWPRTIFPSMKPHREQDCFRVVLHTIVTISLPYLTPPPPPPPPLPSYISNPQPHTHTHTHTHTHSHTSEITVSLMFAPLSMFKFNMYAAMTRDNPWSQMMGGADPSDEEQDTVKV